VPEALKPRRIEIAKSNGSQVAGQDNQPQQIEHDATETKTKAA
jgi:hypothetical protein